MELLRQVPPLSTEEPEAILRLVSRLDEIYALGLIDDRGFITRILPLVSGALLRFFGGCLRNGRSWQQCKGDLLDEFFPHFVRERMIQDLNVFNFHEEGQSLRDYVDRVFAAVKFLGYCADEQQLVGRILMNLHPSILAQAAFLERPHSRGELYNAVGLIEEKFSVLKERQRTQPVPTTSSGSGSRGREPSQNDRATPAPTDVGIVAVSVILDAIVVIGVSHRETGRCPVVVRAPGIIISNNSIE